MKVLSCATARRRLQAYHDDELSVGQQIEVDVHLEGCAQCTAALEELDELRLRATCRGDPPVGIDRRRPRGLSLFGRQPCRCRAADVVTRPCSSAFRRHAFCLRWLGCGRCNCVLHRDHAEHDEFRRAHEPWIQPEPGGRGCPDAHGAKHRRQHDVLDRLDTTDAGSRSGLRCGNGR